MISVRHIIRRGLRNLTVVGSAVGGLDVDLLIGAGCVRKVISPYVGAEALASIGPFYRAAAERGEIEVWECDEGQYYAGLQAAGQMLPFMPTRGGVGTSYPEVNPDLKLFTDPVHGQTLLAVPAIEPDLALLHAAQADAYGNVQFVGTGYADRLLWRAATRTLVQVEKVVSNEEIRRAPERTALLAHGVVRAPFGAHPFSSPGFYLEDRPHIALLVIPMVTDVAGMQAGRVHFDGNQATHIALHDRDGWNHVVVHRSEERAGRRHPVHEPELERFCRWR